MIRTSDLFLFFFSVTDKNVFEKKKKDITKFPAPKDITDVKHFDGKANVAVTKETITAGRAISSYVPLCQGLYDKLMKANEDTVKIMKVLVEAFNREAEIYRDLTLANASIDVWKIIHKLNFQCAELSDLFNTLKWVMNGQSEMMSNLASQMEDKLGPYFSYYRGELTTIKEVLKLAKIG